MPNLIPKCLKYKGMLDGQDPWQKNMNIFFLQFHIYSSLLNVTYFKEKRTQLKKKSINSHNTYFFNCIYLYIKISYDYVQLKFVCI